MIEADPNATPSERLKLRFTDDRSRFENSAAICANGAFSDSLGDLIGSEQLQALLVMEYHRLEKCLAMPERREGAGQDAVTRLVAGIETYRKRFGDCVAAQIGLETLDCYRKEFQHASLLPETKAALERAREIGGAGTVSRGGFRAVSKTEFFGQALGEGIGLLTSRHSVRDYTGEPVSRSNIEQSIRIALSTPSVCNRQAWSVYAIDNRATIAQVLNLQNGNRGFAEKVASLLVVSVDQRRFASIEERNQGWIDGGLFSMTLLYGLHGFGLGCCPLNWCSGREHDQALRDLLGIPNHESVVMLVSVGHVPETFKLALSTRREVGEVLRFI
jgi:nitroreductase